MKLHRCKQMIALQVDEYEYLINEMSELHETSLEFIQMYIKEVNSLLVEGDGFHADMISKKIELVLQTLQKQVIPNLEATFSRTENQAMLSGERMAECDESGRMKVQWEN